MRMAEGRRVRRGKGSKDTHEKAAMKPTKPCRAAKINEYVQGMLKTSGT